MMSDGPHSDGATTPPRSLRCLIVDDDPFLRMLVVDTLREMGHEPIEAPDPDVALENLRQDSVDVLITDMRLPFMDGSELAEHARRAYPNLRVVFATAYSESRVPDLQADPLSRYLRKPFGRRELEATFLSFGWRSPHLDNA